MGQNDAYRAEIEEEISYLKRNLEGLERDKKRLPWLFLATAASIPAGILLGLLWFLVLFVGSIAFFIGGNYIVAGHGNEYRHKLASLEAELKNLS